MHKDRPSLTAAIVSFARGAVSRDSAAPCFDPVASSLVPPPFTQVLRLMEGSAGARRVMEPVVRALMFGIAGHVEMRTAVIDRALEEGVAAGARQLVVLGAGLDSRAWRMGGLSEVDVFEVDHPNTQAWKHSRVSAQTATARSVRFVPVDFERTSLGEALDGTSFRREVPTFWIWEGVTPYLNPPAIEASLDAVADRSAPGSRVALTYVTPDVVAAHRLRALTYPVLKLISEPLQGIFEPQALHALLTARDFGVLQDELPADAAPRFGRKPTRGIFAPSERVVVATKR